MGDQFGLNGFWAIDPTRSEAPNSHLQALGLGDLAQSAATRINSTVSLRVLLRGSDLSVTHMSSLGDKERHFVLGEPLNEVGRDGTAIRMTVELLSPIQMRTTAVYGKATFAETKTLTGPDMLVQEIAMTLRGAVSKSTRVFTRTTEPPPQALDAQL